MKLYDFPFSPNSRKVRAVAYELGIALETQRVDLLTGGQRDPEFLARNPNGRVPVLESSIATARCGRSRRSRSGTARSCACTTSCSRR